MNLSDLAKYDFYLPKSQIAISPVKPAENARLLVYLRKQNKIQEGYTYADLPKLLPQNSLVIYNNTRVIPARIWGKKMTGGRVELLFLNEKKKQIYLVMIKGRVKIGQKIILDGNLEVEMFGKDNRYFLVKNPLPYPAFIKYLEKYGKMPIPPYIKTKASEQTLRQDYQTVFGKEYGSVASPTASLHFSENLLKEMKNEGLEYEFITLHVGLGTFAKLVEENFKNGTLHAEKYEVATNVANKINRAKKNKKPVVAIGTTTVRSLESMALGKMGKTDLFIQRGFKFKVIDALVTNFHLPRSSLLLLVSAFIGSRAKTLNIYNYAVENGYRFYSFGDGMLIL
jgi:S-adenosylmethionine:tRNA ribosyltransferase-isomerase